MKKIIIAPASYHQDLLIKYRNETFSNIKIISKEELIFEFLGASYTNAILPLMLYKKCTYQLAKEILLVLPFIDETKIYSDDKLIALQDIKSFVKKIDHAYIKNPYAYKLLENKEIIVDGYSKKDREIALILKPFLKQVTYIELDTKPLNENYEVTYFDALEDEALYLLNNIASLIDNNVNINDIYILTNDKMMIYYLKTFSADFGYFINDHQEDSLLTNNDIAKFINDFKETKDLIKSFENIRNKEIYNKIKSIVDEILLFSDLNYSQILDILKNKIKEIDNPKNVYKNAVNIISSYIKKENAHIFVPCFIQGVYPNSYDDNDYLSDNLKDIIGLNTSINKTIMEESYQLDFFNQQNIKFYFSYSLRSIDGSNMASPYIKRFSLKVNKNLLPETIYSNKMGQYLTCKYRDLKEHYKEDSVELASLSSLFNINYNSYDNSYSKVDAFNSDMPLRFSYSGISPFFECRFKFYLANALKLDPFEGSFNANVGNLTHAILEKVYDEDFDFEKEYALNYAKYNWAIEENIFLNKLKFSINELCKAIILHKDHYLNKEANIELEKWHNLTLSSGKTTLGGKIDKAIIIDKDIYLIDYKTGKDTFNAAYLEEGLSLQLPTYALLIHAEENLKDFTLRGLFLEHVIIKDFNPKIKDNNLIYDVHKLDGLFSDDIERLIKFDSSFADGSSYFIKSLAQNKKEGGFRYPQRAKNNEEFKNLEEISLSLYNAADKLIRENDFIINPYIIEGVKDASACKYCPYHDICFVKASQKRLIKKKVEEE